MAARHNPLGAVAVAALVTALLWGCGADDTFTPSSSGTGGGASSGEGGEAGTASSSGTGGASSSGTGGSSSSGTGGTGGSSSGTAGEGGSTGPHSVGGTVFGLLGSGLLVQNNGGDDLTISANGPFEFPAQLGSGASYDVTVATQPSAPDQICQVENGQGTVGSFDVTDIVISCELPDGDGDGVPDPVDPYPNDPSFPTTALSNRVYPHTATTLFTMNVNTYAINSVGSFWGSTYSGSMTDMAIDQWGVLYGVTFGALFVCDAASAECRQLATLPQSFNGLTMVPPGTLDPVFDVLVAIAISGDWYRIDLTGAGTATYTLIGSYGSPYSSSGDAFSIEGVGTYAAVDKMGMASDYIISVNPQNGSFIAEVGPVTGYTSLFGLAGYLGEVYGFDAGGAVIRIDLSTGIPTVIAQTPNTWWGAAVSTRL